MCSSSQTRAREFPDGWVAVFSEEYGREYFWHRPSGATSWEAPVLSNAEHQKDSSEVPVDVQLVLGGRIQTTRRNVRHILFSYDLGEELHNPDLKLVRALLQYHPDAKAKVGCGVCGIKVDTSLHPDGSRCFWVRRIDGSLEDFSAKKCFEQLQYQQSFQSSE